MHDLSQIATSDFVYVMRATASSNRASAATLRRSLMRPRLRHTSVDAGNGGKSGSERCSMCSWAWAGFFPTEDLDVSVPATGVDLDDDELTPAEAKHLKHQTLLRPLTLGNWIRRRLRSLFFADAPLKMVSVAVCLFPVGVQIFVLITLTTRYEGIAIPVDGAWRPCSSRQSYYTFANR